MIKQPQRQKNVDCRSQNDAIEENGEKQFGR